MLHNPLLEGIILQAGLILSIGAQNIFLIECSLKKEGSIFAAFLCFFWDLLLIGIGVGAAGKLFSHSISMRFLVGLLGGIFLLWYGVKNLRQTQFSFHIETNRKSLNKKNLIFRTALFSLLNPNALIDTLVIIGGYSTQFNSWKERSLFGLGAGIYTLVWALSLVALASYFQKFLIKPKVTRAFYSLSGFLMLFFSLEMFLEAYALLHKSNIL